MVDDGCGTPLDCGTCSAPETCNGAGVSNVCGVPNLPPNPEDVAPALPAGGPASTYDSVSFVFAGATPVQVGVAAGAVSAERVATLRGRVLTADGAPLAGAKVAVHDAPQLGFTLSRQDGGFILALNGGSQVTLDVRFSSKVAAGICTRTSTMTR